MFLSLIMFQVPDGTKCIDALISKQLRTLHGLQSQMALCGSNLTGKGQMQTLLPMADIQYFPVLKPRDEADKELLGRPPHSRAPRGG